MFRNAVKIGVKISFGTDAAVFPHGQNAKEFALMVGLGMKPIDALLSATSVDAELFGVANKLGTLEKGKLADVIAMPGRSDRRYHRDRARLFCHERRQDREERREAVTERSRLT